MPSAFWRMRRRQVYGQDPTVQSYPVRREREQYWEYMLGTGARCLCGSESPQLPCREDEEINLRNPGRGGPTF